MANLINTPDSPPRRKICLDPLTHSYYEEGTDEIRKFVSVSSVLDKYTNTFDAFKQSEKCAVNVKSKYYGMTPEAIRELWNTKGKEAIENGNNVHGVVENYIKSGFVVPDDDKTFEIQIVRAFHDVVFHTQGLLSERILYFDIPNSIYTLCGTADLLFPGTNWFNLFDIKTGKKPSFFNGYDQRMTGIMRNFPNTKLQRYIFQLNIYAFMYQKETGKDAKQMTIIWFNESKGMFERIHVPAMQRDVKLMIMDYFNVPKKSS